MSDLDKKSLQLFTKRFLKIILINHVFPLNFHVRGHKSFYN